MYLPFRYCSSPVVFCFVLYGCETWSLAQKEEHRMTEKEELRRIFGCKGET
jgi:hypothetical protein